MANKEQQQAFRRRKSHSCQNVSSRAKVAPQWTSKTCAKEIRSGRFLHVLHKSPKDDEEEEELESSVEDIPTIVAENNNEDTEKSNEESQEYNEQADIAAKLKQRETRRIKTAHNKHANVPLFFIHGVGGSSSVWDAQIDYFYNEGFEIIVPDIIGHGLSDAPKSENAFHFQEILADMLAVFDRYSKSKNIVVGHSYGASFAAVLARRRANQVFRLVLISGGSPTPLAPQPGLFNCPTFILSCFRPILQRGFNKSAFHEHYQLDKDSAFDVPMYVLKYTMNGQIWLEGDALYHQNIHCPTLIIHGLHDQLVSVQDEQEMHEIVPDSDLEILENASHMVMMEQPESVNRLIHEFIQNHPNQNAHRSEREKMNTSTISLRSVKSIPNNLIVNNLK